MPLGPESFYNVDMNSITKHNSICALVVWLCSLSLQVVDGFTYPAIYALLKVKKIQVAFMFYFSLYVTLGLYG